MSTSEQVEADKEEPRGKRTSFLDSWRWVQSIAVVGLVWYLAFSGRTDFPSWVYVLLLLMIGSLVALHLYSGLSASDQERVRRLSRLFGRKMATNWPGPAALFAWGVFVLVSYFLILPSRSSTEMKDWLVFCAQAGAASFLAAGLIYTHRSSENSRKTLEHQQRTSDEQLARQLEEREDARRSEQNERFFKAVELLGEKDNEGAHIGALLALEQLANESDVHYYQVIEAICAFVRNRSVPLRIQFLNTSRSERSELPDSPPDIQLAMTILGRRKRTHVDRMSRLNLHGAYLTRLLLRNGSFQGAEFDTAICYKTIIGFCSLTHARFLGAQMEGVIFINCNLCGVSFNDAEVTDGGIGIDGSMEFPYFPIDNLAETELEPTTLSRPDAPVPTDGVSEGASLNYGMSLAWSDWDRAEVTDFSIRVSNHAEGYDESLDLSSLQGLTLDQWNAITKPDGTIAPHEFATPEPTETSSPNVDEERDKADQNVDSQAAELSKPVRLRPRLRNMRRRQSRQT